MNSSSSEDKPVNPVAAWTKGRKDAEKTIAAATDSIILPEKTTVAEMEQFTDVEPERLDALFATALRTPPISAIAAQIEARAAVLFERNPVDEDALRMAMLHRIFRDTGRRNMGDTGKQEVVGTELPEEDVGN
ncbi:hypothetical protein MVEN_00126300 [Mycena venus]|uniref:Uncharacterized protein n=1 Tax=Mycena venus TaxID=2733690 RepID=A0A8H6Z839_9AGAR|nr:hypothetical protein MVEN_00126300 [Mycena venus]